MKSSLSHITAILAMAMFAQVATAQLPAISFGETPAEFSGRADVDGNGLPDVVIVDKASGTVRISYQTAAGVFSWDETKASGIGGVTGVTAGRLLGTASDALAVTSPEANRINILAPAFGSVPVPKTVFVPNVGPNVIVASNLSGTIAADDLWVGSAFNAAPQTGSFDQFVNNPAGTFSLNSNRHLSTGLFTSANAVTLKSGLGGTFAYMERMSASDTLRVISAAQAGAPVKITLAGLSAGSSYLIAPFGNSSLANVLTWKEGQENFKSRRVSEPVAGSFTVSGTTVFPVYFPIGQLLQVPTGATTSRLLAISVDGLFAVGFDFDGTVLSDQTEILTAAPGERFTGAVAIPGYDGFHLLSGSAGDGRTTGSRYMKWDPTSAKFADVGGTTFGAAGKRSGAGNVLVFSGEPFVSPNAKIIARLNTRDWSSGVAPLPPAALNVTGEIFDGNASGLHSPQQAGLGSPPAGATHVLLNQFRPFLSFFSLSHAEGSSIGEPSLSPDGGNVSRTVQISFSAPAGMTVKFRADTGAWITYTPPGVQPPTGPGDPIYEAWWTKFRSLIIFKDSTVQYYGEIGTKRSAIRTASFHFTLSPDQLSALNDGVPDYVKLGRHYNPFLPPPNLIPGEQGGFPGRLLGGAGGVADPRSLSDTSLDLFVRPMSLNGFSNSSVPSLLAKTVLADNTEAVGNRISAFNGTGVFLAGSDETTPPAPINPGLRLWGGTFAEPSARLSGLSGEGNGGFAILATAPNFAIAGPAPAPAYSSVIGREMVALVPLPALAPDDYLRVYSGGSDASEAAAWVSGAIAFHNANGIPRQELSIDFLDTLEALVFERWLLRTCIQRGFLPPTYNPPTPDVLNPPAPNPNFLSLTSFRPGEVVHEITAAPSGPVYPTAKQLRALQVAAPPLDAYRLTDVISAIRTAIRDSPDADIESLRAVTRDVYRISSRYANEIRGGFDPPVETLRRFLATGAVPPIYGNKALVPNITIPPTPPLPGAPYSALPDARYASAIIGLNKLLQQIQARPLGEFDLTVRADSLSAGCTLLDDSTDGSAVSLLGFDGNPFQFPYGFQVATGTRIHVSAYTDFPPGPCGAVIEVLDISGNYAAQVTSVPASKPSASSNLLPDDWQLFFFGKEGLDPFSKPPGGSIPYLQLYLEGIDPTDQASLAALTPLLTGLPPIEIQAMPGNLGDKIAFNFPTKYAGKFDFQMQTSTNLGNFGDTVDAFHEAQPGKFESNVPPTGASARFWRVGFSLK